MWAFLTKQKNFPRPNHVALGKKAMKELKDVAKRLYRVLAHAYYHHKELFEEFEKKTSLYRRFSKLCMKYKLANFTPPIPLGDDDDEE
mmetsp:Transcript_8943/g.17504  ORF Transcript_8943/g.17504 Transcript_8943/m.17504 type:complete len:88 (-) Transcript_8943:548-811(-)